jgi:hypothetical protein
MRSLVRIVSVAALLGSPASARAGLIFEIDGIAAHHIEAAEVGDDHVTVTSRGQPYTVQLPASVGSSLVVWAQRDTGGPLVFSVDGSLVSTDGDNYWPPSVPFELARLVFSYDNYAHEIACGATLRRGPELHPLVQLAGEAKLPYRMHKTLLDPATRTPQAYSYRQLTERYIAPPGCVGELSLYAVTGNHGVPVGVQPRSWIHMLTEQWYRGTDVPSEWDKWAARLPYQPLKNDMERRWSTYRSAFRPLDSLSSIVEAMALLRAVKRDAPSVWLAIQHTAPKASTPIYDAVGPLDHHGLERESWHQLTHAWLEGQIETPAQANLALALAVSSDPDLGAAEGVEAVAARDQLTGAKLQLARLLFNTDPQGVADDSQRLFDSLSQIPGGFRLRAFAVAELKTLARSLRADSDDADEDVVHALDAEDLILRDQEDALKSDFLGRAEAACASSSGDLVTWENLSRDVYSVGLLRRFMDYRGWLPPRVAAAVACIHFRRGMAVQQGRQLAYRHAHYRFLKYLAKHTGDAGTRDLILRYQRALAGAMNLHDSDLTSQVQS